MKYKIIALIGEAGAGKDYILERVSNLKPSLNPIVSCTTRPKREGEVDGVDYYFLSGESFGDKVLNNEMLEVSCFNEWFYGTSYDSLRSDCVNIGVFNPDGIDAMLSHKSSIDLYVYYIEVSDKTRMLRQLNREKNPDVFEIVRRFHTDVMDFSDLDFHYNAIPNETDEDLAFSVKAILAAASALEAKIEQEKLNEN